MLHSTKNQNNEDDVLILSLLVLNSPFVLFQGVTRRRLLKDLLRTNTESEKHGEPRNQVPEDGHPPPILPSLALASCPNMLACDHKY